MGNYTVDGFLPKGFTGGITYTTLLAKDFNQLQVKLDFDKREVEAITNELVDQTKMAWQENFDEVVDDKLIAQSIEKMKAEINVSIFINDNFIGSAHRDNQHKSILITPDTASLGFMPYNGKKGILKVILNIISIVNDDTRYTLEVVQGV